MTTLLSNRAIVRLSPTQEGEDVAAFLQGLVTQDVLGPLPAWGGLLSAQGKALFTFFILRDGADILLDCEAHSAAALARRLSLYRLRRPIAITQDSSLAVHWRATISTSDNATPDPRLAALGERWLMPAQSVISHADTADSAYLAHRLALGVPEGETELGSDQTLWLECNAVELHGVSFTKGCYVGQENTARMNWRQKVNRRLIVVAVDRSNPKRQRAIYPELGWAIDHLRLEDITSDLQPAWLELDES